MLVLKGIGWLFIAAALFLLGRDLLHWQASGHWAATSAGKLWYELSPGTLNLLQAGIERHVWQPLWSPVLWLLLRPSWIILAAIGLLLAFWSPHRRRSRFRLSR